MDKLIYLDNAATTAMGAEVVKKMTEAMTEDYFNPSALYVQSVNISQNIRQARDTIKSAMHAPDGELYFTSGGTEANNTALFSLRKQKGSRIIVGAGEHDSINAATTELLSQGYDVQFAPINSSGVVIVDEFKKLLNDRVSLVSVMHASNETGGINDISALIKLTKQIAPRAVFHCDGVQAFGKIPVNLRALGVDLYSVSAHKLHGPKGIGALFVKKGVSLKPLLYGGGQEKGMRSGTENYPAIVGFEEAVKSYIYDNFNENYSKISQYREYLCKKIKAQIDNVVIITDIQNSVPNVLSVAFKDVRGEVLLHSLEKYGILVGIGSACSSHHESRFKSLLGLDENHRDGIIRFSISDENDVDEVDTVVSAIKDELSVLTKFRRV
ncbi:MAG: cysteine desulfurase [Bacteroides sp.]|nr:cysteine desulfurase [Bacillota bacterium]MCM1394382.1 cysteine desulfurase [[Eubacterium] siraeum]MCM1455828.1 cysteine desulfurase [Bacteroides sp.]